MLKILRNVFADSAAAVADCLPVTEPVLRAIGRAIEPLPQVGTLYRRGIDTLVERWQQRGQQYRQLAIGEVSFLFDVSDFTSRPWYFHRRLFEPETTRYLLETLQTGMTVLDIGANRGYVTLISAAKVGPSGHVHSFEPNPSVRDELLKHVAMNQMSDRVTISPLALSNQSGQSVTFYVSTLATNSGLSSLTPSPELLATQALSASNTIQVETRTLADYLNEAGITTPIDLIKIDVEGAEALVLQGAESLIRQSPPRRWIVETEPDSPACALLTSHGYHRRDLDPAGDKVNALFTRPDVS